MFDIPLRPLKDSLSTPLLSLIPPSIHPNHLTLLAFLCGLASCVLTLTNTTLFNLPIPPLFFWLLNRLLDCLDGSLARHRGIQSTLGGFLDLLGDFVVYALIPVAVVAGNDLSGRSGEGEGGVEGEGGWGRMSTTATGRDGLIVAMLEGSFYVNCFVLFYIAALVEKAGAAGAGAAGNGNGSAGSGRGKDATQSPVFHRQKDELTSLAMRPALIEGFESGVLFTLMLAFPTYVGLISTVMLVGVVVGTGQRTTWLVGTLRRMKTD